MKAHLATRIIISLLYLECIAISHTIRVYYGNTMASLRLFHVQLHKVMLTSDYYNLSKRSLCQVPKYVDNPFSVCVGIVL